eukprot:m.126807 g.126807  ORF g.126807 m.126807 type:complete len:407 (+) comp14528_c0_seq1:285-1505(+)
MSDHHNESAKRRRDEDADINGTSNNAGRYSTRHSKRKRVDNEWDTPDGHYRINLGSALGEGARYKMLDILGEGTFGKVIDCFDRRRPDWNLANSHRVAVKVIKSISKYREAAKIELRVLKTLVQNDPDNKKCCIRLRDYFDFRNHICMVFDKLGLSLYDHMKANDFNAFDLRVVQHFAVQLVIAIDYLHSLKLTHTDLKPENIMLVRNECKTVNINGKSQIILKCTEIQVIDFGSATFEDEHHTSIVSTRHYRAPEVILGLGWSHPCDIWSLACILLELNTGEATFQTHEDMEHLAMMQKILGPIPKSMANRTPSKAKKIFFDNKGRLLWPERAKDKSSVEYVLENCKLLKHMIPREGVRHEEFYDMIQRMLRFESGRRISAARSLNYDFIKNYDQKDYLSWLSER